MNKNVFKCEISFSKHLPNIYYKKSIVGTYSSTALISQCKIHNRQILLTFSCYLWWWEWQVFNRGACRSAGVVRTISTSWCSRMFFLLLLKVLRFWVMVIFCFIFFIILANRKQKVISPYLTSRRFLKLNVSSHQIYDYLNGKLTNELNFWSPIV